MTIIGVIVTVFAIFIVVGVLLWLVNTFIPMQPTVKDAMNKIVVAVVVIAVVLWLLSLFVGGVGGVQFPRVR